MSFDPQTIRHLFPMLHSPEPETGRVPIFFDNPAGTQVPVPVMEKVSQYFMRHNANMGGHFARSQRTGKILYEARQVLAEFAPRLPVVSVGADEEAHHVGDDQADEADDAGDGDGGGGDDARERDERVREAYLGGDEE